MLLVQLKGGLGNQMFQYAAGRQASILSDRPLYLDLTWYEGDNKRSGTYRKFELEYFNIAAKIADRHILENFYCRGSIILKIKNQLEIKLGLKKVITESDEFKYKDLRFARKTHLKGYWQSDEYFTGIRKHLLQEFSLKKKFSEQINTDINVLNLIENIKNSRSVSIHFRRGDYVSDEKTRNFHGICEPDYYHDAFKIITEKIGKTKFFIFSDDPDWVESNILFDGELKFVKGFPGYIDMYLMSLCQCNIIANSSFSWWGAWLNNNPDKIIIAPKRWYLNSEINTRHILPQNWITI